MEIPVKPATVVVNGITVKNVSIIPVLLVKLTLARDAKMILKFSLKSTNRFPTCRNFLLNRICIVAEMIDNSGGLISLQSSTISTLPNRMANSNKYVNRSEC